MLSPTPLGQTGAHFFDLGGPSHYSGYYLIGFERCGSECVATRRLVSNVDRTIGSHRGVRQRRQRTIRTFDRTFEKRQDHFIVSLMGTPASVMALVFRQSRDLRPSAESETRQKIEPAAALAARSAQPAAGATSAPPPRRGGVPRVAPDRGVRRPRPVASEVRRPRRVTSESDGQTRPRGPGLPVGLTLCEATPRTPGHRVARTENDRRAVRQNQRRPATASQHSLT